MQDEQCSRRFFLRPVDTQNNREHFRQLLELFRQDIDADSDIAPPASIDAFPTLDDTTSARWWQLALLRRAQFCGGRPGHVYQLGIGCRLMDNNQPDMSHQEILSQNCQTTWRYIWVNILGATAILAVFYHTCVSTAHVRSMLYALNQFTSIYRPPPPPEQPPIVLRAGGVQYVH